MDIILPAITTGILLSLILIGPVFFLLIETSLTKGYKSAIVLDLGVILADFICIFIAYYGSNDISNYIERNPSLYRIGGFIVAIYGLFMFLSKGNRRINQDSLVSNNYFKTFLNGFLLNLVNVGVVTFWISTVLIIRSQFGNNNTKFFLFIAIVFITFIIIDLSKIFLANKFKAKLTDRIVFKIKKIIGLILVLFGIIFFAKSYKIFDDLLEHEIKIITFKKN